MKNLCVFFFLLMFQRTFSQTLNGSVSEAKGNTSIPFATMVLIDDATGQFLSGATADENGLFTIFLPDSPVQMEVTSIGYLKKVIASADLRNRNQLHILLEADVTTLQEVVVTAEKPTVQLLLDKKVINVSEDMLSSGGSAVSVLERIPEIQIGPNGAISMRGSENVNILVNGKPSSISASELLKQIPSASIKKIEIITSPSAKYTASGLTGIINIVTDGAAERGTTLNISSSANSVGGYSGNVQFNHGKPKLTHRLNISYRNEIFKNNNSLISYGPHPFSSVSDFRFKGNVRNVGAGVDWYPNKLNEFTFGFKATDNSHDMVNASLIGNNGEIYLQSNLSQHLHQTIEVNGNYRHIFDSNSDNYLEVDFRGSNNNNVLSSSFFPVKDIFNNESKNDVLLFDVSADYVGTLNANTKLEAGLVWDQQVLSNRYSFFDDGGARTSMDSFNNTVYTYASYAILKYNLRRFQLQAGLRNEIFNRFANAGSGRVVNMNKFNDLFPSFHASWNLEDGNVITFGYNRRTSRPSLMQVNPNTIRENDFQMYLGNPSLQPEFSNNVDLSLQIKRGIWEIIPSFGVRAVNDVILTHLSADSAGIMVMSPMNSGQSRAATGEVTIEMKLANWWDASVSAAWSYENLSGAEALFARSYRRGGDFSLQNTLSINPKTTFIVSTRFSAVRYGYTYRDNTNYATDIAIRRKMLDERLTCNLRLEDILNSERYIGRNYSVGFEREYDYKPVSRIVYFTISYNLNSGKLKDRNMKSRNHKSGVVD